MIIFRGISQTSLILQDVRTWTQIELNWKTQAPVRMPNLFDSAAPGTWLLKMDQAPGRHNLKIMGVSLVFVGVNWLQFISPERLGLV